LNSLKELVPAGVSVEDTEACTNREEEEEEFFNHFV
jgi:hypothetical protein